MMKYAIIGTGGKQLQVEAGKFYKVEKIDVEVGKKITIEDVFLYSDGGKVEIGTPMLEKRKVSATIVEHGLGKKIVMIKMRRRKHSMKKQGHRQKYTTIKVEDFK